MKTVLFFVVAAATIAWLIRRWSRPPSRLLRAVDAIMPAYNEELCITASVEVLLENPYLNQIIVVNDGSSDSTAAILDQLAAKHKRLVVVHQANTGKGGALMAGLARARARYVFLTDADTFLPPDDEGLGYMIAEMQRGADAVGGVPSSNLAGAGLLPHIRATVKLPMIVLKRMFQQIVGGAPFIVSGACGMFRTEVLRKVPFSDRTKVEDLDLTWSLVAKGYRVRQTPRCIVYAQECNSLRSEWLRWRRWIIGYAVCMRLHRRLLLSRFGLFSILPMFLVVVVGIASLVTGLVPAILDGHVLNVLLRLFPLLWLGVVCVIGLISAVHHRQIWLIALAPAAVFYVFLSYAIWLLYGLRGLVTGSEPERDKPTRYAHVVG
ncbi:MAG: glycosyltransferase family 2 protein [Alphaproteobacteria bacterium]|nr:glycosyltransferase family 2 protein [Alphaproteobacteria bacterium]